MSDSPTSWPATCSTMEEPKRTGYPGKDIKANVRHPGNCNCFLLLYQRQLENKKHTYS